MNNFSKYLRPTAIHRSALLAMLLLAALSFAQEIFYDDDGNPILPRGKAPWEIETGFPPVLRLTQPPDQPVRAVAEWEEVEAIMVRWPNDATFNSLWAQFLEPVCTDVKIYVICANQTQVNSAMNLFDNTMPLDSFVFQIHSSNSIWIRDYGPWWVWQQNDWNRGIVDWIYNRPQRPQDNAIPEWQADTVFTVDYYGPNLTFTGGNFMVDGWGKGFCSELVFDENGTIVDEISELDSVLGAFMDLDTVYTFPRFFGIDHIDMSMKLLNDHTLILNEYPAGNQYNDEMDSCETIIGQITNPWGQPIEVHRVTTASWNGGTPYTYTNAIFVNNKVLLPIYGGSHAVRDAAAIALWESLLPGYSIHGFNCTSIIPLQGAIHCVVKEVIHRHLIRIEYPPLPEELANIEDGEITARIVSLGTLDPDSIELYWATDEAGPWFAETFASLGNDSFHVNIPPQPADDILYYYVRAKNTEGNWTTMPRYGPEAHYQTSFPVTTPAAPESLTVWTDGDDVILQWTPVTEDILGNPITNVTYLIHGSPNPDSVMFPENEIGATTDTTFTINDFFTEMNLKMYFRVIAFIP